MNIAEVLVLSLCLVYGLYLVELAWGGDEVEVKSRHQTKGFFLHVSTQIAVILLLFGFRYELTLVESMLGALIIVLLLFISGVFQNRTYYYVLLLSLFFGTLYYFYDTSLISLFFIPLIIVIFSIISKFLRNRKGVN